MLIPPLSPSFSMTFHNDTEESLFEFIIEYTGPNGHKIFRLSQVILLCANAESLVKTNFCNKVTLSGTMGIMERKGHFASGIEIWEKFGLGIWRDRARQIEASCALPVSLREERAQRLENPT